MNFIKIMPKHIRIGILMTSFALAISILVTQSIFFSHKWDSFFKLKGQLPANIPDSPVVENMFKAESYAAVPGLFLSVFGLALFLGGLVFFFKNNFKLNWWAILFLSASVFCNIMSVLVDIAPLYRFYLDKVSMPQVVKDTLSHKIKATLNLFQVNLAFVITMPILFVVFGVLHFLNKINN